MTKRAAPPRKRPNPPSALDAASLRELAFGYVARYATSRRKLSDYLKRKLRTRGWEGDDASGHVEALVAELADKRFVDDATYAATRAGSLLRRGYGARRVRAMYHADGIAEDDRDEAEVAVGEGKSAALVAFARRRRLGPFAPDAASASEDERTRERALAAMVRAGHAFGPAKKLLALNPLDLDADWDDDTIEAMIAEDY